MAAKPLAYLDYPRKAWPHLGPKRSSKNSGPTSEWRVIDFLITPSFFAALFCRSRNHNWLIESTLAWKSPADSQSARIQNARYLITQDRPVDRRSMEVRPAGGVSRVMYI